MTSDNIFERLLEFAPDAMIVVDQGGVITLVNRQAEKMFGYSPDEMIGEPVEMLVPRQSATDHVKQRQSYASTPRLREMGAGEGLLGLLGLRRDGSEFSVEIGLSPFNTADGPFVCSTVRDVTARKKMEQEIVAARQEADRANKANSAFLAAASHDLRQPVQALSLLSGAMRRTTTDPKMLEMIDIQSQSLTAMTNLLNSLLDISRLNAGAVAAAFEDFPIAQLLEHQAGEFSRQARQKGLSIEVRSCAVIVRSDPNLLAEILQNFVSNSVRYTKSGKITIQCSIEEQSCRVQVCDTGIGIEADQLEEIFTEFHQCRTVGASAEGFGLGLAIVRRLSDLLGHKVEVDSEPGSGSCFSIIVPIMPASRSCGLPPVGLAVDIESNKASGTVVLIEDDIRVSNALQLLFESAGYVVASAVSVADMQALLETLEAEVDLIVADYHLVGAETGIDAIRWLRSKFGTDVPAFVITGDTSDLADVVNELPNCMILRKPVDSDLLLQLAEEALQSGETTG